MISNFPYAACSLYKPHVLICNWTHYTPKITNKDTNTETQENEIYLWLVALFLVLSLVISSYAASTQPYQFRKLLRSVASPSKSRSGGGGS
ncbi:uncharacterized protein LOC130503853 [Raphanus sativus]|uniref:Uncharacterized protein LOC130503853 n=1 Tax=Raphanus sativus TaxID=3726 RepID=A0A9W3CSG2_RAPSA|nr:uncharacterized protein LOC130503853 [Raphanus sativus]